MKPPTKHTTDPTSNGYMITSKAFGYKFLISSERIICPSVVIESIEQYNDFQDCYTYAWGLFLGVNTTPATTSTT